jgi:phosphatidylinositol 3-kinase
VVVGGATLTLFSNKKHLRTGKQKLRLWRARRADGSVPTSTPGKVLFMTLCSPFLVA